MGKLLGLREQRDSGRAQVLDTIRNAGPIARIDIAEATGFSPATVTAITSELMLAGLIVETPLAAGAGDDARAKRGRPRVLLKLNGAARLVAGLKVAHRSIWVQVVDFEGTEIVDYEMQLARARMQTEELCNVVIGAVEMACAKGGIELDTISGMCVAMAGQITDDGFVHWSSSLIERNVDLGPQLQARAPCPVFIGNDANLVAKAEHLFGKAQSINDFLVVTVEHGVGLGIVLGGKLYGGTRGCGAEFGHVKVQLGSALCQCGQRGCLEAYVGDYALLREAQFGDEVYTDVKQVFAAADAGDAIARSVLERASRMFAMGIANLINIFDPQLIILAGARTSFGHLYNDDMRKEIRSMVVQVDAPLPNIEVHQWGDAMWAKGAAAYAIERVSELTIRELAQNAA
ncbi:MAG: ROK family transcriptional regulator [Paracoccaceae bacterium]